MTMFARFVLLVLFVVGGHKTWAVRCSCKSTVGGKAASQAQLQQERYETRVMLETYGIQVRFPILGCGSDGFCNTTSINAGITEGMIGICWNYTGPFSPMNQDTTLMYWRDCAAFKPSDSMPASTCLDLGPLGIKGGKRCTCYGDTCNLGAGADTRTVSSSLVLIVTTSLILTRSLFTHV